jgi:predicted DNA binding protein
MREFTATVPYSELEKFGVLEVIQGFRSCGVEEMSTLVCKGSHGVGLVEADRPLNRKELLELDYIHRLESLGECDDQYEYLFEMEAPKLDWVIDEFAFQIFLSTNPKLTDHGFEATFVGSQKALNQAASALDDVEGVENITCEITHICDYSGQTGLLESLTNRQQEVMEMAHSMGYYDIPRRVSSDDLGDSLELEKSTVLEHLRRAEYNLLRQVFGEPEQVVYK